MSEPPVVVSCLRCKSEMIYASRENLEHASFFQYPLSGSLTFDMWVCPQCRHIELFLPPEVRLNLPKGQ